MVDISNGCRPLVVYMGASVLTFSGSLGPSFYVGNVVTLGDGFWGILIWFSWVSCRSFMEMRHISAAWNHLCLASESDELSAIMTRTRQFLHLQFFTFTQSWCSYNYSFPLFCFCYLTWLNFLLYQLLFVPSVSQLVGISWRFQCHLFSHSNYIHSRGVSWLLFMLFHTLINFLYYNCFRVGPGSAWLATKEPRTKQSL